MKHNWHLVAGGGNTGYFIYTDNKDILKGDEVVAKLDEFEKLVRYVRANKGPWFGMNDESPEVIELRESYADLSDETRKLLEA